ncbi:uncharacterized protein MELLADRAFT_62053 [Melampsora larici-populina 98AG31]|uniref:Uncharacterized protein n=1 Tax=Melampsora larici-populina (strain 98AG31 / pathotype 3-4-7) TaxID=747676 RepID=F4RH22_MELLP|nr:uncharacterized protein MELLADRAFT_62053 [Melampsora larici-populina 98AG31]EGG08307.1 hypothetical protein MELLADRAFT_62053 [Melampsora larici-populina 98AG31]
MPRCLCSNCEPRAACRLMSLQPNLTNANFDEIVLSADEEEPAPGNPSGCDSIVSKTVTMNTCKEEDPIRTIPVMLDLFNRIRTNFDTLYESTFHDDDSLYTASDLLNTQVVWNLVKNCREIRNGQRLPEILGSETIRGCFSNIVASVESWFESEMYKSYMLTNNNIYPWLPQPRINKRKEDFGSGPSKRLRAGLEKTTQTGGNHQQGEPSNYQHADLHSGFLNKSSKEPGNFKPTTVQFENEGFKLSKNHSRTIKNCKYLI